MSGRRRHASSRRAAPAAGERIDRSSEATPLPTPAGVYALSIDPNALPAAALCDDDEHGDGDIERTTPPAAPARSMAHVLTGLVVVAAFGSLGLAPAVRWLEWAGPYLVFGLIVVGLVAVKFAGSLLHEPQSAEARLDRR